MQRCLYKKILYDREDVRLNWFWQFLLQSNYSSNQLIKILKVLFVWRLYGSGNICRRLETAVMTSVHSDSIVQLQMKAVTAVSTLPPCTLVITAISSLWKMCFLCPFFFYSTRTFKFQFCIFWHHTGKFHTFEIVYLDCIFYLFGVMSCYISTTLYFPVHRRMFHM